MKKVIIFSVILFFTFFSTGIWAEKSEKVALKCHIELFGGVEVIHFVNVVKNDRQKLIKKLTGKSITVTGNRKKQKIYQAKECVDLNERFKGAQANQLDANTVR